MATTVTANVAGVFAEGATVGAYPASNWPTGTVNQSAAPLGSATATGTVTAGSVTINSLTTNTQYALAVSGGTRYLFANTTDVTPDTGQNISSTDGLVLSGNGGKDTLNLSNTTANVGLTIGGDAELYRPSAARLRTDAEFLSAVTYHDFINSFSGGPIVINGPGFVFSEQAEPAAPAANYGVLFCRDNGSGKTQIVAKFPTGAVQVIATQP